jgi:hypothetical protein
MQRSTLALLVLPILLSACVWGQAPEYKGLNQILQGYVRNGKVDYSGIRQKKRSELQSFVDSLAEVDVAKLNQSELIAFWLNAYNGLVIYQIVEEKGTPDSAFSRGEFFRRAKFRVAREERSLDDIEHRALRPLAKDPRVHFVLVCGAQSCPQLKAEAFLGTKDLEQSLEEAAKSYVNDSKNVFIDREHRKLVLNKIFDWYAEDFGDVVKFVARYRSPEERQLLSQGDWDVDYRDYDWNVNQSP